MNLKVKKLIYNILFCTVFVSWFSLQACYKEESCNKKKITYFQYPCRLPACKAGFNDSLIRDIHESNCITNYTPRIQQLYLEQGDFGFSVMYYYTIRQELYAYINKNNHEPEYRIKQEAVDIQETEDLHSEEF